MFGLIRDVVRLGLRWTLMFGPRTKACAWTDGTSKVTNGNAAAASTNAARRVLIRQLARSWTIGPLVPLVYAGRPRGLRRRHRETDDFLALQLADQAGDFVLRQRLSAELQP